jgi:pSer/pThr/pTyr-binding forkhead associated (FHA) protein
VLIRPDGTEGGTFQLNEGATVVGRDAGPMFTGDTYLSPRHALFTVNGTTVTVRDESSLNGVYVRIPAQTPVELADGEVFRIGQEILHYEAFPRVAPEADGTEKQGAQIEGLVGRIALVVGRESTGNAFPVPVTGLFLGRERGDILFPEDGYVSGLHCQLTVEGTKLLLNDVGSSNGTYVRLRAERPIKNQDLLLIGQQLFRLNL